MMSGVCGWGGWGRGGVLVAFGMGGAGKGWADVRVERLCDGIRQRLG